MLDTLDLQNIDLFKNNSKINFSDINIIYGKNGTGKSTMVGAIEEQINDPEHCVIFNGIERFIRPDKQLNSILLGTRNLEIEAQIQDLSATRATAAKELAESSTTVKKQQSKFNTSVNDYQDFVWENIYKHFQKQFPTDLIGWGGSKKTFSEKLKQLGRLEPINPKQLLSESDILEKRGLIKAGVRLPKYDTFAQQLNFDRVRKVMSKTIRSEAKGQIAKKLFEIWFKL